MRVVKLVLGLGLAYTILLNAACGAGDLHRLNTALNTAATSLNAAAKTNHQLYEGGVYGPVGSPAALAVRQHAATIIHDSNEHLITALNLAKALTTATFEQGKLAVLQALAQAAAELHVGQQAIDLALQAVATAINSAVILLQALRSADLQQVLPIIQHLSIEEVTV